MYSRQTEPGIEKTHQNPYQLEKDRSDFDKMKPVKKKIK